MSAYIVPKEQIDVIVSYFVASAMDDRLWYELNGKYGYMGIDEAPGVAMTLWAQNVRSVDSRYNEENDSHYEFKYVPQASRVYSIGEIAQAMSGLEYQSCETDDYFQTDAYKLLTSMRKKLLSKIADSEQAETWSIDSVRHQFAPAKEL